MSFEQSLEQGRIAEGLIAKWLMARGTAVMPAYEIEIHRFKGPQLFTRDGEFVAPDMLAFTQNGIVWVEAKHKSVFTWHRISGKWTTGIDLHHYEHYQKVSQVTALPVWLLFYHRECTPDERDRPHCGTPTCPVGLFGQDIVHLAANENHRHGNWGPHGMVYWAHDTLKRLATVEDVMRVAQEAA